MPVGTAWKEYKNCGHAGYSDNGYDPLVTIHVAKQNPWKPIMFIKHDRWFGRDEQGSGFTLHQ